MLEKDMARVKFEQRVKLGCNPASRNALTVTELSIQSGPGLECKCLAFISLHWVVSNAGCPRKGWVGKISAGSNLWGELLITSDDCQLAALLDSTLGVSNSFSWGGHISLVVAFKGPSVILGLYKCNYSLTVKWEALPLSRNKVPSQIKQVRGPDSALSLCVCHLCSRSFSPEELTWWCIAIFRIEWSGWRSECEGKKVSWPG